MFQFQLVRLKFYILKHRTAEAGVSIPTGSIKIRIKNLSKQFVCRFQFQLVRLKSKIRLAVSVRCEFQFQLVRLKFSFVTSIFTPLLLFQFQLVRLKYLVNNDLHINLMFQFQLVRLKLDRLAFLIETVLFQFQLVRLKLLIKVYNFFIKVVSIPTGSIKIPYSPIV